MRCQCASSPPVPLRWCLASLTGALKLTALFVLKRKHAWQRQIPWLWLGTLLCLWVRIQNLYVFSCRATCGDTAGRGSVSWSRTLGLTGTLTAEWVAHWIFQFWELLQSFFFRVYAQISVSFCLIIHTLVVCHEHSEKSFDVLAQKLLKVILSDYYDYHVLSLIRQQSLWLTSCLVVVILSWPLL